MSARGEPRTRRYPCPWCARRQVWPDLCTEDPNAPDEAHHCSSMISRQCMRGDHRRCRVGACTISIRWHEEVRAAGAAATQATGRTWAIVSTIDNDHRVKVVGTSDHLGRAKLLRRTVLINAGHPDGPDGWGLVYVVRGSDGGFL